MNLDQMKYSLAYKNILLSNLDIETYSPKARKIILLNILLYVSSFILGFFTIYNFGFSQAYIIGVIDLVAFLAALYAIYYLRVFGKVYWAAIITTLDVFFLVVALIYFVEGANFTLIWTIFLPIFAIFINGSRNGLLITILFYIVIFSLAYNGLGEWQNGAWNMPSFTRLVAASITLTLMTYFFEQSLENAYIALEEKRDIEASYIRSLEICSITDPLTSLYNRRHLDVQFRLKFAKAKQEGKFLALFILDLDKFKGYNDTYGHKAGDDALVKVAKVLQESLQREADSTFRLGGEEFCGLFMANEHNNIVETVQRLRESIKNLQIEHKLSEESVLTASFGICIINSFKEENLDKMYKIADDNLYLAKEEGRNRVVGEVYISTL